MLVKNCYVNRITATLVIAAQESITADTMKTETGRTWNRVRVIKVAWFRLVCVMTGSDPLVFFCGSKARHCDIHFAHLPDH